MKGQECSICLDDMNDYVAFKCNHSFHSSCIVKYLFHHVFNDFTMKSNKLYCPLCRQLIVKNDLVKILNLHHHNLTTKYKRVSKELSKLESQIYWGDASFPRFSFVLKIVKLFKQRPEIDEKQLSAVNYMMDKKCQAYNRVVESAYVVDTVKLAYKY